MSDSIDHDGSVNASSVGKGSEASPAVGRGNSPIELVLRFAESGSGDAEACAYVQHAFRTWDKQNCPMAEALGVPDRGREIVGAKLQLAMQRFVQIQCSGRSVAHEENILEEVAVTLRHVVQRPSEWIDADFEPDDLRGPLVREMLRHNDGRVPSLRQFERLVDLSQIRWLDD